MYRACAALILLLLSACNGNGLLRGSGESVPPPPGYAKLCAEHPDFEACKP